jgi:pimeloyl-ACP methyl ester carboxylesterase
MATFILVHGTWAKHAPWTLPGSLLRKHIEALATEAGQLAHFEPLPWGGHNFGRSRLAAAHAIAEKVRSLTSAGNDEKLFLIGHSHGGSAIAYFLKHYPALVESITGVAFLSTPFVATRLRPRCTSLLTYFTHVLIHCYFIYFGLFVSCAYRLNLR